MNKNTLTTYEIAEYCQVTPRTVIQWINEDKLKAYRTPGNHSRVTFEEFLNFLKKYNMPIPERFILTKVQGKKRVLVVDDDKGTVDVIMRLFREEKEYLLEGAYDGFEAGEKFAIFKPQLIVLDIQMPGIDGYKVCSRIKSDPKNKDVKIFFISGTFDAQVVKKIKKLGADDYMPKPLKVKELKEKITNLLDQKRK